MIPVRNIYYMLAYAFSELRAPRYKRLGREDFPHAEELLAEILILALSSEIKRGLHREYVRQEEALRSPKGKLEISASLRENTLRRKALVCTYDEFSLDSYPNRIIKTAADRLLHTNISKGRKHALAKLMLYFTPVALLDPRRIDWHIRYGRNDRTYRMLIGICRLILSGGLQDEAGNEEKQFDFDDAQRRCRLYEKFLLGYFRREHRELAVSSPEIPWALDGARGPLLPRMQSDVVLRKGDRTLIIDAKYYTRALTVFYDSIMLRSVHLYQIFTYVKNEQEMQRRQRASAGSTSVSGMLLYAKTNEDVSPDESYLMSGSRIDVRTLDLSQDFETIRAALDAIADDFFGDA